MARLVLVQFRLHLLDRIDEVTLVVRVPPTVLGGTGLATGVHDRVVHAAAGGGTGVVVAAVGLGRLRSDRDVIDVDVLDGRTLHIGGRVATLDGVRRRQEHLPAERPRTRPVTVRGTPAEVLHDRGIDPHAVVVRVRVLRDGRVVPEERILLRIVGGDEHAVTLGGTGERLQAVGEVVVHPHQHTGLTVLPDARLELLERHVLVVPVAQPGDAQLRQRGLCLIEVGTDGAVARQVAHVATRDGTTALLAVAHGVGQHGSRRVDAVDLAELGAVDLRHELELLGEVTGGLDRGHTALGVVRQAQHTGVRERGLTLHGLMTHLPPEVADLEILGGVDGLVPLGLGVVERHRLLGRDVPTGEHPVDLLQPTVVLHGVHRLRGVLHPRIELAGIGLLVPAALGDLLEPVTVLLRRDGAAGELTPETRDLVLKVGLLDAPGDVRDLPADLLLQGRVRDRVQAVLVERQEVVVGRLATLDVQQDAVGTLGDAVLVALVDEGLDLLFQFRLLRGVALHPRGLRTEIRDVPRVVVGPLELAQRPRVVDALGVLEERLLPVSLLALVVRRLADAPADVGKQSLVGDLPRVVAVEHLLVLGSLILLALLVGLLGTTLLHSEVLVIEVGEGLGVVRPLSETVRHRLPSARVGDLVQGRSASDQRGGRGTLPVARRR